VGFYGPDSTGQLSCGLAKSGRRLWNRLHKIVYLAGVAGVLHYWMLVKSDTRLPLTFAFVLAVLLGYRLLVKFAPPPAPQSGASLFPPG